MAEQALDQNCLAYQNRRIHVGPIYGWGWLRGDVPPGFDIRIVEFCRNASGDLIGGLGRVESETHKYADHWVVFRLRHLGKYDFKDKRGDYDIRILRKRPQTPQELIRHHRAQPLESQVDAGYAIIGEPPGLTERLQLWKLNFAQLVVFAMLSMPVILLRLLTNPKAGGGVVGDRLGVDWFLIKGFALMVIFWGVVVGGVIGLIYGAYHLAYAFV